MASYNKVLLMGNLTRDIELRYTPNNTAVADIGIAVNRKWRNQQGEMQEEVSFVDCTAFGRTAEVMSQYLGKGKPVFVEGRLKMDQWEDKQTGQNRSKLKVVIESFEFIDSRGGGQGGGQSGDGGQQSYDDSSGQRQTVAAGASHQPVPEDDIPF